jgi:hypothetical protein
MIFPERVLGSSGTTIIVRGRVAGLLYAGYRTELRQDGDLDLLWAQGRQVARELLVRDLVDERARAPRARRSRRGRSTCSRWSRWECRTSGSPPASGCRR